MMKTNSTATKFNPKPWVIVTNAGMENEDFWCDYADFSTANKALKQLDDDAQIMKRLDDGTLTTEF